MTSPLLVATDLCAAVSLPGGGRLVTVDGASLTVHAGESLSIVGRSGSGKTSLISILGLLNARFTGRYEIAGRSVADLTDPQRAELRATCLGFVFQSYSLVEHLTAMENVVLPLRYGGQTSPAVALRLGREALLGVGLADRGSAMPRHLSGGEQQRVAIARALVNSPDIVLADEPTGALDTDTGDVVMDLLLDRVRARGSALVLVTHDRDRAAACDVTLTMDRGRLLPDEDGGVRARHAC